MIEPIIQEVIAVFRTDDEQNIICMTWYPITEVERVKELLFELKITFPETTFFSHNIDMVVIEPTTEVKKVKDTIG